MSCWQSFQDYGLRSLGIGERLLPRGDAIDLCTQTALIGSGLLWNFYFLFFSVAIGFFCAVGLALMRNSTHVWLRWPAESFVFIFRGSPLFLQFFFAYSALVLIPKTSLNLDLGFLELSAHTSWLSRAWLGALLVLIMNTAAYSAEIFLGAMRAVPKGDVEAAYAFGMTPRQCFLRIVWPSMLRLAWPAYTNEVIFLFHATTLVFLSSFPAWGRQGDALFYAQYFTKMTFNPFVAYPIIAGYFIVSTLLIIALFSSVNRILNKHNAVKSKFKFNPRYLR